ncbi:hypothetical protein O3M35_012111 [Rhynocoris fuscipes]|uniref:K Homology domain-containing protein n=1 Tax=Rhynocoris fuscipes TaxID=488301 RepID=A0AAW1CSC0_9HEMI
MAESVSENTKENVETTSEQKDKVEIKEEKETSGKSDEKNLTEEENKNKVINEVEKSKTNEEGKSKTIKTTDSKSENKKGKEIVGGKAEEETVEKFIEELMKEEEMIDKVKCPKIRKLIDDKKYDLKNRGKNLNVTNMMKGSSRIIERVYIPSIGKKKPQFLIPKLIGLRGQNLRRIERDTKTKLTIRGKGSKIRNTTAINLIDPKYDHLSEEAHIEIVAEALPDEAHLRISHAIKQLRDFIINEDNIMNGKTQQSHAPWNQMRDTLQIIIPRPAPFDSYPQYSDSSPSAGNFGLTSQQQQHYGLQTSSQNYLVRDIGLSNGVGNNFASRTNLVNGNVFRNNGRSRVSPYLIF